MINQKTWEIPFYLAVLFEALETKGIENISDQIDRIFGKAQEAKD
jgi:hypothetical protein